MLVKRAAVCGYCMGVERAIKKTYQELESHPDKTIVTLGPLIHNPYTLSELEKKGVSVIKGPAEIASPEKTIVMVRAHGVPPQIEKQITQTGAVLVDATCPKVQVSQKKAANYEKAGYRIIIAGEKDHSEIVGILGYAPTAMVIKDMEEAITAAEAIKKEKGPYAKAVLLAQTTYSETAFVKILAAVRDILPALEVEQTICKATRDRQEALFDLCKEVDAVLVIGGKESANTQRLKTIAEEQGLPAWLIENEQEIPEQIYMFERVGLTAGASTPQELIDRVEAVLRSYAV